MKLIQELGARIEKYKRQLFNDGYSYEDARAMVQMAFEETGLKFEGFFELNREDLKNTIAHLDKTFAK